MEHKTGDKGPWAIRVWKGGRWVYVGPHFATMSSAIGWMWFVRSYHGGAKTMVISKQQADAEAGK
jgi:hypothetical protein